MAEFLSPSVKFESIAIGQKDYLVSRHVPIWAHRWTAYKFEWFMHFIDDL